MLYISILILIFICLFVLYSLSKNDFMLLRKDISLTYIFNCFFITLFAGFIAGRLFYILDVKKFTFLNPIIFFHFFRYSGFSWFGMILGGAINLYFLIKDKKALPRIFDIFYLSLYLLFIFTYIFSLNSPLHLIFKVLILLFFTLLYILFLNFHKSFTLKDGSIFLILLMIFSIGNFFDQIFNKEDIIIFYFSLSQFISLLVFLSSIFLLLKNEKLVGFKK